MIFTPAQGYFYIEEYQEKDEQSNWQFAKSQEDLRIIKILASYDEVEEMQDQLAVVISNMIQKFEFQKKIYKIVPESAVIGYLDKDEE